ncbi:unnamed protein product, partial [Polarella glacialis]
GLSVSVLYGGARRMDQLQALRRQKRTHLIVATTGRLLDFVCDQKAFRLRLCSFFVLDEGDRMLDSGFEEDVARIAAEVRPDRPYYDSSARSVVTWISHA